MPADSDPVVTPPGPGRLVGVGVGPGDPALLTLEALATVRRADRVVAPTTGAEPGRAQSVLAAAAPEVSVETVTFSMTADDGARAASYDAAAERLCQWLDADETVAFVTLGDPNVYSTFPTLAAAVRARRPGTVVRTVAGICAFQALAARTQTVLLDGTESLALVTALDGTDALKAALAEPSRAVVVYKGGRHLPAVAALLEEHDRLEGAVMGELLGLDGEHVGPVADRRDEPASYLATVIVPPAARPAP